MTNAKKPRQQVDNCPAKSVVSPSKVSLNPLTMSVCIHPIRSIGWVERNVERAILRVCLYCRCHRLEFQFQSSAVVCCCSLPPTLSLSAVHVVPGCPKQSVYFFFANRVTTYRERLVHDHTVADHGSKEGSRKPVRSALVVKGDPVRHVHRRAHQHKDMA